MQFINHIVNQWKAQIYKSYGNNVESMLCMCSITDRAIAAIATSTKNNKRRHKLRPVATLLQPLIIMTSNVCDTWCVMWSHSTKFERNQTIRSWVAAIYRFKIWGPSAILDLTGSWIAKFRGQGPITHHHFDV